MLRIPDLVALPAKPTRAGIRGGRDALASARLRFRRRDAVRVPALVLAQEKRLDVGIGPSLPQGRRTVQ